MEPRDRKLVLLQQLSQEIEPITLPALLKKLDKTFAERTVRRWLDEMAREGVVEKIGQKRGTRYRALGHTVRNNHEESSCFSSKSVNAIKQVRRPLFEREPVGYDFSWLLSYRPDVDAYLPERTKIQLYQAGLRAQKEDPAGTYAHQ